MTPDERPTQDNRKCKHCGAKATALGPIGMWQHCPEHEGGSLTHEWADEPEPVKDEMPLGHEFIPHPGSLLCVHQINTELGWVLCLKFITAHQQAQKDGEE